MSRCECWKNRFCQCMARVPFASVVAAVILIIGISVFCVHALRSTDKTEKLLDGTGVDENDYTKQAMNLMNIIIYAITGGMAGMAVILVIIGVLSTGDTRLTLCFRYRARMCSRFAMGFFFLIYYILTVVWFVISCGLCGTLVFSYMISDFCGDDYDTRITSDCLDLRQYGLTSNGNSTLKVCDDSLKEFCQESQAIKKPYLLTWAGAAIVVIGLLHALICLGANYAHVKDTTKTTKKDYEQVQDRTPDGVELKDYPS
ncbi:proteolipid protein DM beta-like [Ptychodera flava]|uniref:proteolipid protein DM beta-like n=1 Tax=Ptychodera flava TaxID=63121 RepID=UPI00396AA2BB